MTEFENELAKNLKFYLVLSELECIELAQKISPELKSFIKEEKDYTEDVSKSKSVVALVGVVDRNEISAEEAIRSKVFKEKDTLKSVKEWFDSFNPYFKGQLRLNFE